MEYITASKIVHKSKDGQYWFGITHNMNIYRGCNQGCIYCDSRSDCYNVIDFDQVKPKKEAPIMIDHELNSKQKKGIIGMGAMSDPYNYLERKLQFTRLALTAMNKYHFGTFCITKNKLVTRDIDVYKLINNHSYVNIGITITTSDEKLQKQIEPGASTTSERFEAIKTLTNHGLYAGILMMPILPYINDTVENIESIVRKAHLAGAKYIYPAFGLTLRDGNREYFYSHIDPELRTRYIKEYKNKYNVASKQAQLLKLNFESLCKELGILYKMSEIIEEGYKYIKEKQLSLNLEV